MLDSLISLIAPHLCLSCGEIGGNLCDHCKYDIENEYFEGCVVCGTTTSSFSGLCGDCHPPYSRAWCVGERSGVLRTLVGEHKFLRNYAAHRELATLLSHRMGELPRNVVVVPIPTIAPHIRRRGYDHMALIARELSRLQGVPYRPMLRRVGSTVQMGSSKVERHHNASRAFEVKERPCDDKIYLIVDDVTTTGATLRYAAKELRNAGAGEVWAAVIARQPLD